MCILGKLYQIKKKGTKLREDSYLSIALIAFQEM